MKPLAPESCADRRAAPAPVQARSRRQLQGRVALATTGNTPALPRIIGTVVACIFISLTAIGQEIGYIDLSDNTFRGSSRQVRNGGGSCGSSPHAEDKSRAKFTVTLVSLDKTHYRLGEEVTFEIRILNGGKKSVVVPWTPHLGDIEPADRGAGYRYRVGVVQLSFLDPEGFELPVFENLYGAQDAPGSLRQLAPGQWFVVRGRKNIQAFQDGWGKKQFAKSDVVVTRASGSFRLERGTYSPANGGTDHRACIPLPAKSAHEIDITIERYTDSE